MIPSIDFANTVLLVNITEAQLPINYSTTLSFDDEDVNDERFPEQRVTSSKREGTPCVPAGGVLF